MYLLIQYNMQRTSKGELGLSASVIATTGSLLPQHHYLHLVGGILFDKLGAIKTLTIGAIAVMTSGVALLMAGTSHYLHMYTQF
ncbi:MAG: hypothetical protein U0Z74_02375 [Romboutsia timonensis]